MKHSIATSGLIPDEWEAIDFAIHQKELKNILCYCDFPQLMKALWFNWRLMEPPRRG